MQLEFFGEASEPSAPVTKAWPENVIVYTDGACRGNPGPSSVGVFVTDLKGNVVLEHGERIGNQTNNFAEYSALTRALELAKENGAQSLVVRADSELMVRQMKGEYKVKSESIKGLYEKCRQLVRDFRSVKFEHVRREFNTEADALANKALDFY